MTDAVKRVLNVGGGGSRKIPDHFAGWHQDVLDIDPDVSPDICMDALDMGALDPNQYDAIICSHNLEHFYAHQTPTVLRGMLHLLKPGGFAEIIVPSFGKWLEAFQRGNYELDDTYYRTGQGTKITFHDVLYGWQPVMAQGNLFYAHKQAFTGNRLGAAMADAGFTNIQLWEDTSNLFGRGFKCPSP